MAIAPGVESTRDHTGIPPAVKNGTSTHLEAPTRGTDWDTLANLYPQLTGQKQALPPMTEQQEERLGHVASEERPSAITTIVGEQLSVSILPSVSPRVAKLDPTAQRIMRTHFTKKILTDLRQIQQHCGEPKAAIYADSLLHTMREMRDLLPFDPYLEVVMALHDALAFQNRWSEYSSSQYAGAYSVLKELVKQEYLSNDKTEKAIMSLEELGFDTTPFGVDVDFEFSEES